MLFNSYIFIFAFLPAVVLAFHALRRYAPERAPMLALLLASFAFYSWWSLQYLLLLLGMMVFDCVIATQIEKHRVAMRKNRAKAFLILGLTGNLCALAYYKYANFFVDNMNALAGLDLFLAAIVLPIGISFFTFQKIAFLADLYQGKVKRFKALDYALFVTFFPQLIAGPIVHHSEMMPQFRNLGRILPITVITGITIFTIGLAKKILLADTMARYASPHFNAVFMEGAHLDLLTAWSAALAYTAQIYFDFSAYSDMAIGIALLFGIRLPVNFDSPYKARSIIEFWRRWHITLSRFLRDYLYIPLGGNRKGRRRRHINLLITMVLGGIWHGAGWTFLIWGALHGLYLMMNHFWNGLKIAPDSHVFKLFSWLVTFTAVVVAWVFFRAANLETALDIIAGMSGQYGIAPLPVEAMLMPAAILAFALIMPNTQQIMNYRPPEGTYGTYTAKTVPIALLWRPTKLWAAGLALLLGSCLMYMTQISEFIYFQF